MVRSCHSRIVAAFMPVSEAEIPPGAGSVESVPQAPRKHASGAARRERRRSRFMTGAGIGAYPPRASPSMEKRPRRPVSLPRRTTGRPFHVLFLRTAVLDGALPGPQLGRYLCDAFGILGGEVGGNKSRVEQNTSLAKGCGMLAGQATDPGNRHAAFPKRALRSAQASRRFRAGRAAVVAAIPEQGVVGDVPFARRLTLRSMAVSSPR